jgi:hypothetical protein
VRATSRRSTQILAGEEEVLSGEGYSYDPPGAATPSSRCSQRTQPRRRRSSDRGRPGLLIDEIEVKGIFQLQGRTFAQVQTSNKDKSYLIQEGRSALRRRGRLDPHRRVTFKQVVNDPSVIKPFREVVKKLNPEP